MVQEGHPYFYVRTNTRQYIQKTDNKLTEWTLIHLYNVRTTFCTCWYDIITV